MARRQRNSFKSIQRIPREMQIIDESEDTDSADTETWDQSSQDQNSYRYNNDTHQNWYIPYPEERRRLVRILSQPTAVEFFNRDPPRRRPSVLKRFVCRECGRSARTARIWKRHKKTCGLSPREKLLWQLDVLETWLNGHSGCLHPTNAMLRALAADTGLRMSQLNNWFEDQQKEATKNGNLYQYRHTRSCNYQVYADSDDDEDYWHFDDLGDSDSP